MIRHHQQYFDYPFNVKLRNFLLENKGNGNRLHKLSGVNVSPYKGGRTKLTSKKYNELIPFINQIKSEYSPLEPKSTANKIYIDRETMERANFINKWCSQRINRTTLLAKCVFANMNDKSRDVAIALVKKYEYVINDQLWAVFTDKINHIKQMEDALKNLSVGNLRVNYISKETLDHLNNISTIEFINSFGNDRGFLYARKIIDECIFKDEVARYVNRMPPRKAHVNNWLLSDKKIKLRLANIAYILNYSENKDDLTRHPFSLLIDDDFFTDENWKQIQSIMTKVDSMIDQNHPFALAAKYKR